MPPSMNQPIKIDVSRAIIQFDMVAYPAVFGKM